MIVSTGIFLTLDPVWKSHEAAAKPLMCLFFIWSCDKNLKFQQKQTVGLILSQMPHVTIMRMKCNGMSTPYHISVRPSYAFICRLRKLWEQRMCKQIKSREDARTQNRTVLQETCKPKHLFTINAKQFKVHTVCMQWGTTGAFDFCRCL